ncbi:MAG: DUF1801 domain-containing protein [Bacteroidia bacterium]|nr:DUF1801 domain-containing protein [Bacteroidia bacterium]
MNINPEVELFLDKLNHPLIAEIQRIREIILTTDEDVDEEVKWSSPTFIYRGNIASFNLNARKYVSLMFHKGALIRDTSGLLEGDGKEARSAKFLNMEDIEKKKDALQAVIRDWIKVMDGD